MPDAEDIILEPIITEKSMLMMGENQYTFSVATFANKPQIKAAVEKLFDVKVLKVNTMRVPGKSRRLGRSEGRTSEWKKAIVSIAEGDSIEFFEGMV